MVMRYASSLRLVWPDTSIALLFMIEEILLI